MVDCSLVACTQSDAVIVITNPVNNFGQVFCAYSYLQIPTSSAINTSTW